MSFYSDFAMHYEAVFPFREPVFAFLAARLAPGARRVLDLGCGTGHYCGRFAAAGHAAVGLDLDPAMIATAAHTYPAARFHALDLLDLDRVAGRCDLVYSIGNVLAHLPPARLPELLAKIHAALSPGGIWVQQTVNWDHILGLGRPEFRFPERSLSDGAVFSRAYLDLTPQRLRFATRLAFPDRIVFEGEVDLFPVRVDEVRRLHAAAGFVEEGHWGDFAGAPFRADAEGGSVFAFRRP